MRRVSVLAAVVALALVGVVVAGHATAGTAAQDATSEHPLVGTWLLDTDALDPANLPEVTIFTGDGAYVSVDAEGTTSLGTWEATGEGTANLTLVVQEAEEGEYFGSLMVRATVEVDASGDAFTAEYTGEFVSADGTGTGQYGPGTATATRIAVEAMAAPVGPLSDLFPEEEAGTPTP